MVDEEFFNNIKNINRNLNTFLSDINFYDRFPDYGKRNHLKSIEIIDSSHKIQNDGNELFIYDENNDLENYYCNLNEEDEGKEYELEIYKDKIIILGVWYHYEYEEDLFIRIFIVDKNVKGYEKVYNDIIFEQKL